MWKDTIRVGVIGVGHLGRHHVRNYAAMANTELIGAYDTDFPHSEQIAESYNIECYTSLDDLLQAVDAVSVATPTKSHYNIVRKALEANCQVIVEKPICATIEEADKLIELAAKQKLILQVGHIERFNGAILAIEDQIINPLFIECHRLAPFNPRGTDVSVILDLTIHDLDIVLGFAKSRVKSFHAVGVPVISNSIDIANLRLEFESGCVANITTSRVSTKVTRKIRFFQKDAYFSVDLHKKIVDIFKKKIDFTSQIRQTPDGYTQVKNNGSQTSDTEKVFAHQRIVADRVEPLRVELESFVNCIEQNKPPIVSGLEGRNALQLAYNAIDIIKRRKNHI